MSAPKPLQSNKSSALSGIAVIPGDKSISHRSLMLGAITKGETIIGGLLEGEDVYATADAMRALGANILREGTGNWRVNGIGHNFKTPQKPLDMGNSGTSTRLIMGLLTSHPVTATLTGDASLSKRPMGRVITPLTDMGATIDASEGGKLPLTITGTNQAKAITYELPVASAQVKSAILLAGLNANGTTTVIESHPTRDHTENMLRYFGIDLKVETNGKQTAISLTGGQTLQPGLIQVPRDPSSAAFPVVAALINEGSDIICENIGLSPTRDGIYQTLIEMGADITITNKRIEAGEIIADLHVKGSRPLKGVNVPPDRVPSMIDEFPILAVAAACAHGTTTMTGLAELRVKESDRLAVMAEGLKACGVNLEIGEESLTIHGTGTPPQGGATIKTHLDHRIAMSFLILGTVTAHAITVDDASPIQTSFPNFVTLMTELGAKITPPAETILKSGT